MSDLREISKLVKFAATLALIGLCISGVGLWTNYWSSSDVYGDANEGLWYGCYHGNCRNIPEFSPIPGSKTNV